MAIRAIWKGELTIDAITCPVALYSAVSAAERISLHFVNRKTGNRVRRRYVDAETSMDVAGDDIVKGFEKDGRMLTLDADELRTAIPESDKRLTVTHFVPLAGFDTAFLERPYHLLPADAAGAESFAVIRAGLAQKKAGAIARAVLFRRMRSVLITATDDGLRATTLHFDHEVRAAREMFGDIAAQKIDPEMRELAEHIIDTKRGAFVPADFTDRYEEALAELVKAKIAGGKPKKPKPPKATGSDLLSALRKSAGLDIADSGKSGGTSKTAPAKRRAPKAEPRRRGERKRA